ncbi:MAG: DUF3179 domain-containing protein [Planctomycetes bacterium]|nr:DUF3179 domain-containing protein [Planctomycetota bacterium]
MYARTLKNQTLTLAVSGMLWRGSLVIIDLETRSLWSHLLGEAMRGPLQGQSLETIPSTMTDWKTWKSSYPETTCVVLPRTSEDYNSNVWKTPVSMSMMVIGLAEKDQARAWHLDRLREQPVVNDMFAGKSVVAVYDEESGTAVLYSRRVDGKDLSFEFKDGKLFDLETGTQWDLITGEALTLPLKGKSLKKVKGIISYNAAWNEFHPNSTYWSPERE